MFCVFNCTLVLIRVKGVALPQPLPEPLGSEQLSLMGRGWRWGILPHMVVMLFFQMEKK